MGMSYIGAPEDEPGYWDGQPEPEEPVEMFGLMLTHYDGQPMDMWVFESGKRIELTYEETVDAQREYSTRNPKGRYEIKRI